MELAACHARYGGACEDPVTAHVSNPIHAVSSCTTTTLTLPSTFFFFFCGDVCTSAGGNVFVALAPVSTSETALANETLVTALAYRSGPTPLVSSRRKDLQPPPALIDCGPFSL